VRSTYLVDNRVPAGRIIVRLTIIARFRSLRALRFDACTSGEHVTRTRIDEETVFRVRARAYRTGRQSYGARQRNYYYYSGADQLGPATYSFSRYTNNDDRPGRVYRKYALFAPYRLIVSCTTSVSVPNTFLRCKLIVSPS